METEAFSFIPQAILIPKSLFADPRAGPPSFCRYGFSSIDAMAVPGRALLRLQVPVARARQWSTSRQLLATTARSSATASFNNSILRRPLHEVRRHYASTVTTTPPVAAISTPPPPPPKKRPRFRWLRWTWRLMYLSALGGLVYVGYGVYLDRHPAPQSPPDPSKKTLVILGMLTCLVMLCFGPASDSRCS